MPSGDAAGKDDAVDELVAEIGSLPGLGRILDEIVPGNSGIGTWLTVRRSWRRGDDNDREGRKRDQQAEEQEDLGEDVEEGRALDHVRLSLVVDAPLDEAELDEGQQR